MLEKMKAAFSRLGVLAAAYLPPGFKEALIEMAHQSDLQSQELADMREKLAALSNIINHNE